MSKPNDGGPAFPRLYSLADEDGREGMSLRTWLAAHETLAEWDTPEASMSKAMAEALAGEKLPEGAWSTNPLGALRFDAKWRAALKLMRADAMIAELEKEKP